MPKISKGNYLYFYQLFSAEVGTGRQDGPQRFQEVLAADGLDPQDVDCNSIEQLLSELDFVKFTVFKKGRVLVTVMPREDLDTLLEKAANPVADKGGSGKSFKRPQKRKDDRPVKPRHLRKAEPAAQAEENAEIAAAAETKAEDAATPVKEQVPEAKQEPEPEPAQEQKPEVKPEPEAEPAQETMPEAKQELAAEQIPEAKPESDAELVQEQEPEAKQETKPVAKQEPQTEPVAKTEAKAEATATPEPKAQDEAASTPKPEPAPAPRPEPAPEPTHKEEPRVFLPTHTTPKLRRISLPKRVSDDVFCPNEQLLELYLLLPDTIGILEALDEGWDYAQQAGTVEGTRSKLIFPLSRSNKPGYPIEVTIERASRIPSGKAWKLVSVTRDEEDE